MGPSPLLALCRMRSPFFDVHVAGECGPGQLWGRMCVLPIDE